MAESQEPILVVITEPHASLAFEEALRAAGFIITVFQDGSAALEQAVSQRASLVVIAEQLRDGNGLELAEEFARRLPALPLVLYAAQVSPELLKQAVRLGASEVVFAPLDGESIRRSVQSALDLSHRRKEALLNESRQFSASLQRQVDELEALTRLGRQITGSLDLDSVLTAVVDAAVRLTGAEEGSLLLLDEASGELYMRASRNFQEDFARTFRLPITDSLAGIVIRSGEAVLVDENTPRKIKTSYLVKSIVYVPLQMHGHISGVLSVDNRESNLPLTQRHVSLLNTLASYAVIALENARLYADVSAERARLEAILTGIQDGVLVIDQDRRLVMVNRAARDLFGLEDGARVSGKLIQDVITQEEMLDLVRGSESSQYNRAEISPDESHVYSAEATPIQGVGEVFTLHDITYLKNLDRIKTDFVHTVSHDLRSPLTAILGYVELVERAGPVNDLQRDFIRRVQVSVHNITHLIDDLLELGRIEAGFDIRKESVRLDQIIQYSAESLKKQLAGKGQALHIEMPADFPSVLANPVQMRQMADHLLDNATKYTIPGGVITVNGRVEQNQVILSFSDTGIGIPAVELPYIFDKFYRASNASSELSGTGLGLAIVKSIVENHGGRIWVDSQVEKGTTFTIVFPLM